MTKVVNAILREEDESNSREEESNSILREKEESNSIPLEEEESKSILGLDLDLG